MSKNLCPENNITFENSQTIRFATPIPAGTYTASAIVESTDTDSSVCLMLFYYLDGSTKEVYINRSPVDSTERVFKAFELKQDADRVRIYASEGYNLSVGDTATFTKLMIEAGDQMTDYVPYGDEGTDIPEFPEDPEEGTVELVRFYMCWAVGVVTTAAPTCRHTMLIKKILDPSYELPFTVTEDSCNGDRYLWDLINGTTTMLANEPESDMEKYFHLMLGGTVDSMPNPNLSDLSYWMDKVYQNRYKKAE